MTTPFPIRFNLKDGTHVMVNLVDGDYEFHLTRLNSEKHNFLWKNGKIEESYETRFDALQLEAVDIFQRMMKADITKS
jgi:hypothetical protein